MTMGLINPIGCKSLLRFCMLWAALSLVTRNLASTVHGAESSDSHQGNVLLRQTTVDDITFTTEFFYDRIFIKAQKLDGVKIHLGQKGVVGTISIQCGNGRRVRHDFREASNGRLVAAIGAVLSSDTFVDMRVQLLGVVGADDVTVFKERIVIPEADGVVSREAIDRQRFCPITGRLLDSSKQAFQVDFDDKVVFCCSEQCLGKIKRMAPESLKSFPLVQVGVTTEKDNLLIELQASCPVMDMPLGSMGRPIKVLVGKQPLYLCCKGCVNKVNGNPLHFVAETMAKGGDDFAKQIALEMQDGNTSDASPEH